MEVETSLPSLTEYRSRARRLLNQLRRTGYEELAVAAAARFQRLTSFSDQTVFQIMENRSSVKLKHALAVIALEHGYGSWRELKTSAETGGRSSAASSSSHGREMYAAGFCGTLNRWFADYEGARASLDEQGGFLLPFESQFFVCEEQGIRALGLDSEDPDWERIGRDWVKPADLEAWARLDRKRELASLGEGPSGGEGTP